MCKIEIKLKKVSTRERVAWKCINFSSTENVWVPLCQQGSFERGKWQIARDEVGFNCYATKEVARQSGWTTAEQPVRVRIRKIEGYSESRNVIFAREIFVPIKKKRGI